ncbi:SpoIIIAH-like family protein [Alteribacter natronophilus]|uniref:SpoIIIAH-like family protein n=1 Tax=Alteribacter natronophilus TaxID=2583810 RepID=UPI00110F0ADB|nr:SpoIIIAH-like family protein [Alteribacter natronophilus]TMW73751.1 SpoIIIAH-like family protein [Alteribacter natronophilus]
MVLKRQTVWLLTMLSLIIVLSVYYININNQDFAGVPQDQTGENQAAEGEDLEAQLQNDESVTFVEIEDTTAASGQSQYSTMSADEMFEMIRLQRQDARGKANEEYADVIASAEASADVQSQAFDGREALQAMAQKEELLETLIKARGYEDALVITEDGQVRIYVKADGLSKEEAVQIKRLAYEELGADNIMVGYQSN